MRQIDRRALFSSGAAAALLAASGVALDAAPKAGGELRIAMPRDGGFLERLVRGAGFDSLTEIAADGALKGELATHWTGSADARRWRFDLREGVVFHDGRPLCSDDVVSSLKAHDVTARLGVLAVRAMGTRSVVLELADPDPDLPFRLASQEYVICAEGAVDCASRGGVGSGCFVTRRFEPGRSYLGHRMDGHYKSGQAGWFDRIEAVVIPDSTVRAEALRDRFVDLAILPDAEALSERDGLVFRPSRDDMVLAAHEEICIPRRVAGYLALDGGRLAERWWRL